MSGNNYTITCPHCGFANNLRGRAMTIALTCQSCHIYFRVGAWDKATVEFQHVEPQEIPIGAKGRIEGVLYEVMGFVVKEEGKYHYRWREYMLFNPFQGYAFLSEYNGHWNFVWPIENSLHPRGTEFKYKDSSYRLYQKYTAQVVYARGEFFFDVVDITASTVNHEYIAPPSLVALEQSEDSVLWCEGEYLSRKEVAAIFSMPKNQLPSVSGIGYTQPFGTSFSDQALILLTAFLLLFLLLIQVVFNNTDDDKVVFQADFSKASLNNQKMLVTPSFELKDGTKSLEVNIYAPLSNDWFFGEFSLINENTETEYNFTKDIEYYSGYEDGYSWTEGSRTGDAFLSRIPSGKYHINIYPEFSGTNGSFTVTVRRGAPMYSNFFVTSIAMAIFPVFYFIRRRYREQKRWSDSDYSPYSTE